MADFEDFDTDPSRGGGSATRLHATISVDGVVTTKLLPSSGDVTIGRSSSCDVAIAHASVSRQHAVLRISPLEITDLGSRNGTRVAGKHVPPNTTKPIVVGDPIQVGEAAILLQEVSMSFDGKQLLQPLQVADTTSPYHQTLDIECARSGRSGSPFAVVQIVTHTGRPKQVLGLLRGFLRTTDVVYSDGAGGFQLLLVETRPDHVGIAVRRIAELLERNSITAQIGAACYPDDGVVAEQLIAHAFERLAQEPDDPPNAMDHVRELVRQVAGGELSVLIHGETGVGKELCAEMIHRLSPRRARPFVKLNCSALVESLIESELFGHERGAFTGATSAHAGLLEAGDGGTVFLDEVGEMPLGVQAKLLRVLEERVVRRVGATAGKKVDVRFVFASNRDLADDVDAGRFRRDLYYRINGVTIVIPPLRERRAEITALARAFALRARPGMSIRFSSEVVAALEHHIWPGNIRELRNTIERAVLLSSGGAIRPSHLVLEPRDSLRDSQPSLRDSQPMLRGPHRDSHPTLPIERVGNDTGEQPALRPSNQSLASAVADLERQRIVDALEQCGGNQTRAARVLGISRNTLVARLEEFGLPRPRKAK